MRDAEGSGSVASQKESYSEYIAHFHTYLPNRNTERLPYLSLVLTRATSALAALFTSIFSSYSAIRDNPISGTLRI